MWFRRNRSTAHTMMPPTDPAVAATLRNALTRTKLELICVRGLQQPIDESTANELSRLLDEARRLIDSDEAAQRSRRRERVPTAAERDPAAARSALPLVAGQPRPPSMGLG